MSTITFRYLCNKYLLKPGVSQENKVEWGYCFDVHLNALFPALVILHGVVIVLYHGIYSPYCFKQIFLFLSYLAITCICFSAIIGQPWSVSVFLGNTLWLIATGYYTYITFLGYSCLPQLQSTRYFLYPFSLIFLVYLISLLVGWNLSTTLVNFYQFRVL